MNLSRMFYYDGARDEYVWIIYDMDNRNTLISKICIPSYPEMLKQIENLIYDINSIRVEK